MRDLTHWYRRVGRLGALRAWPVLVALTLAAWFASALICANDASRVRSAIEVVPQTAEQLDWLVERSEDLWTEVNDVGRPLVGVFDADDRRLLEQRGVGFKVVVEDIDEAAADERARLSVRIFDGGDDWYGEYRDVIEVSNYMTRMARRHPDLARIREIGGSIEGWPIRSVEIGRGGEIPIVLTGGHHAREWISVMVTTCVGDRLLENAATDARVDRILEHTSFSVAPLINPDGYAHSWTVDRYWRKNRRGGHGVDLNRNYSVAWGQRGSSSRKSSQTYRGEAPFSEPETRAAAALFEGRDVRAHLDFHSYSQLILYPWTYQRADPPDRDRFAAASDRMATAMYAAHGKRYEIVPGSKLRLGAAGTSTDWSYGERGALSFTVELRPAGGRSGFVLPPEQIVPTCDEGYAATLELADWLIDRDRR